MSSAEEQEHLEAQDRVDGLARRQFLQWLGTGFAALSLPACDFRAPREKIIPYLEQPEEIVPGVAAWYASTCAACPAACGVLVKCREGRPIKLEGNPDHALSQGGLCARGQASVLDLYDSGRLRGPRVEGKSVSWAEADAAVLQGLEAAAAAGGRIVVVSRTVNGPARREAIQAFLRRWKGAEHVVLDAPSHGAIREAHRLTHGESRLPSYRFDRARVIVSFDADFLGTWLSPVEFTRAWAATRRVDKALAARPWHAQVEARLSLTGANADLRTPLAPSRVPLALGELAHALGNRLNARERTHLPAPGEPSGLDPAVLAQMVTRLSENRERSLVVSGSSSLAAQLSVNAINHMLANYGSTVDLSQPSLQALGSDPAVDRLIDDLKEGRVPAIVLVDGNPGHQHPRAEEFRAGIEKAALSVSLAGKLDETASVARIVCPDHHALESWGDASPHVGVYSLFQPVIAPLSDTRAAMESLLTWADAPASAYEHVRRVWKETLFPLQDGVGDPNEFWEKSVHDGTLVVAGEKVAVPTKFRAEALAGSGGAPAPAPAGEFELTLYESLSLGNGDQANNPWLQELPDPITKVTWGNCASLSPAAAARLGDGRLLELSAGGRSVRIPAHVQAGMADGVVAVALGYGRPQAGIIAANYPTEKMFGIEQDPPGGADLYPFLREPTVSVRVLDQLSPLARTQEYDHQTDPLLGHERPIVLMTDGTSAATAQASGAAGPAHAANLWPAQPYPGHKWGMAIDLNACSGCGACTVACQAENNVPVVGKAEIRKSRDMFWIRVDRYYEGSPGALPASPRVSFMPMLCQHCDHAPCETVCPVLATLHSSEGLNMQVYNRCVGTRYCANNCPYKVRRFNWFDYAHNDLVQNLVLNPDVAVRTRGVMEKCSFCVQRISEAKIRARGEDRGVRDGEVMPACVQSCPAGAIVFGDVNDVRSRIARLMADPRGYKVLDEVGTRPAVTYLKRVRNGT